MTTMTRKPRTTSKPAAQARPLTLAEINSQLSIAMRDADERLVSYIREYKRANPYGNCPLPTLYRTVAEPSGLTIGQFHDAVRGLVSARRVRLHPWTQAPYLLQDEQCGLMMGQELKFYVEVIG